MDMILGVAWPVAALIIVFVLRNPISSAITILAQRLEQVGGDSGAKFNKTWKEGIEQASRVASPETDQAGASGDSARAPHKQSAIEYGIRAPAFRPAGSVSPREAINSAKSRFDHMLQWAAVRTNVIEAGTPHSFERRIALLVEGGYLDRQKAAVLSTLVELYAASCRKNDSRLTLEDALKFQQLENIAKQYLTQIATLDTDETRP